MAKEELLEMRGRVVELLPNAMFRVELDNNQIGDISALATLPTLDHAILDNNRITSLAPLTANPALRPGSIVFAAGNDIDANADATVIANLLERGISLQF